MDSEQELLANCLEQLNALPNIRIVEAKPIKSGYGTLVLQSPFQSVKYSYKVRPSLSLAYIEGWRRGEEDIGKHRPMLFIANYAPDKLIAELVGNGIEFIDRAGNAYLNSPAAYIFVSGRPKPQNNLPKRSKITVATLQLIYLLLKNPQMLAASYRDMAEAAGISLGTISYSLTSLYELGYLERQRNGRYRITNYRKLLERWEMGYVEKLRPKLLLGCYTTVNNHPFSETTNLILEASQKGNFLIGGELAAAIATSYLYPQRATLHLTDEHRQLVVKLKLKPHPQGEIIMLRQFGTQNAWDKFSEPLVDPLLIHSELLVEMNDRLNETAERIYQKYLITEDNA